MRSCEFTLENSNIEKTHHVMQQNANQKCPKNMQVQQHNAKKNTNARPNAGAKAQVAFFRSCSLPKFCIFFSEIMFVQLVPGLICIFAFCLHFSSFFLGSMFATFFRNHVCPNGPGSDLHLFAFFSFFFKAFFFAFS